MTWAAAFVFWFMAGEWPARVQLVSLRSELPMILGFAAVASRTPECRDAFARHGFDVRRELASGRWRAKEIYTPLERGKRGSRTVTLGASACGSRTVGLSDKIPLFGPLRGALTLLHELAHMAGCKNGAALTEEQAKAVEDECREGLIRSLEGG